MIQGLYTAANGMLAVEAKQSAIANNIANTSTPGYKRSEPVLSGFYTEFSAKLREPFHFDNNPAPGGGVRVGEVAADLSEGALLETDNPLSMALQGPGFFVVDTPNGERYTRSGAFTVDKQGQLATQEGYAVQAVGVVSACAAEGIEIRVLGGGSNLLVRDEGVSGCVLLACSGAM